MSAQIISTSLLCLWMSLFGCSESTPLDRESWLLRTLTEDHLHLVARDPELVAGKYAKMRGEQLDGRVSLYPYFRGTLSQMYRDVSGGESVVIPSVYTSAESAQVFLVGDPHLENVSASLGDDGLLRLEWDDFDSAGYGPWIWDVRRLALSLWTLHAELQQQRADENSGTDHADTERVELLMKSLAVGYLRGVDDWRRGERAQPREGRLLPLVIRRLFQEARERVQAGKILERYTVTSSQGERSLKRGTIRAPIQAGVIRDALLTVNQAEEEMILAVDRSLRDQGVNLGPLLDYARRYGQGVSSYPLMRFYLLFEGESASADDDQLWEVKELGDRPVPSGLSLYPPRLFGAQGDRVLKARRALQWGPLASPRGLEPTTWVDVGNLSFRARQRTDYQRGLDLDDIIEQYQSTQGERGEDEALREAQALAELLGSLLSGAHCFADTLSGQPGGEVISADLDRVGREVLEAELTSFTTTYGPLMRQDRDALSDLIQTYGPTLGARGGAR